jgi:hypothetical protein
LLRAIADGKVPFDLLDDQRPNVTIEAADSPAFMARLSRQAATPLASQGVRVNQSALEYIASMWRGKERLTMPLASSVPRLELPIGADRTGAALSLDRMREALERYVATHAAEVRVNPPKAETWQRVTIGRDLEISARGPLSVDEIQLLETIGQLLQRAIYRKEGP